MDVMTTIPRGNELTRDDLESMPGYGIKYELIDGAIYASGHSDRLTRRHLEAMPDDDGRRYELLDGVIVVSAAPSNRHQGIVGQLIIALNAASPPDFRVRPAPFDVTLSEHTVVEPDVLVARAADLVASGLPAAPALAVEVLSPSSRQRDLTFKRELYEAAGCPWYWVVDPGDDATPPSLIVWELKTGKYVEVARVAGDETWSATLPFPVTVVPNDLLDD